MGRGHPVGEEPEKLQHGTIHGISTGICISMFTKSRPENHPNIGKYIIRMDWLYRSHCDNLIFAMLSLSNYLHQAALIGCRLEPAAGGSHSRLYKTVRDQCAHI